MKFFTTVFFLLFGLSCFANEPVKHPCNESNYEDYIYDSHKTNGLIEQTGKGCYLRFANFIEKGLREADFRRADLHGAILRLSDLRLSNFSGADLSGAYFAQSDFRGANFSGADLRYADFSEMSFYQASVSAAASFYRKAYKGNNFRGADFSEADLRGADLDMVFLDRTYLNDAFYNDETNLPRFDFMFKPKEKGMIYRP